MRRIFVLITAFLAAFSAPAFAAHTGTLIAASGWEGYGAPNPINGNDFFYPYQVAYPNCFQIATGTNLPWDPNGVNNPDHYLKGTTGATCAGGGAPNPGQGVYFRERSPHRGHDLIFWFRLDGNVSQSNFIIRLNDSTVSANTGVYRGAVDYTSMQIDTSNVLHADAATTSQTLTVGTWYQVEFCFIAGVNGSGTIPTVQQTWVNQSSVSTSTPATTPNHGGGDTITFDNELGGVSGAGTISFGPWADYDPGASCPATALATLYYVGVQPKANVTTQLIPFANTNWQNAAASSPGALSYNYSPTAGNQDIYSLNLGVFGTILAVTNRISVEADSGGMRAALPLYNNGSTTSTCPIGNGFSLGGGGNQPAPPIFSLQNGTFQSVMCSSDVDPFTGVTWTTTTAGRVGVQVDF